MLKINYLKSNAQNQYKRSDGLSICFLGQSLAISDRLFKITMRQTVAYDFV